jgi:hypothetical protein
VFIGDAIVRRGGGVALSEAETLGGESGDGECGEVVVEWDFPGSIAGSRPVDK